MVAAVTCHLKFINIDEVGKSVNYCESSYNVLLSDESCYGCSCQLPCAESQRDQ